ncbi:hypothetical protein [Aliarcobacter cibarius]|uniref:Uncharacterized protein n=1 Tax=Aliarcobacter cibarius TaxID=255507 RepID=A0ABY2V781_9BACT|nr:hypothetical protein [Aliarcobacter cibarius]TLT00470.1 hypothetical protein FE247_04170 [Aliarcobacter cibarius]TLT00782.1 hypothetical protein FE245_04345 [Aliarcobacter cibarius]
MMKNLIILFLLIIHSNANESLIAQKQNTLYVHNLIEIEEKIAQNFEKYLLDKLQIPTINNLINENYLGINFSVQNKMGSNIDFRDTNNLQIKYAITKNEFINSEDYLILLYNRDLYRDYTTVNFVTTSDKKIDLTKSFVEFKLKSPEAMTIFNILKNGETIVENCSSSLINKYCINDKKSIRWYNSSSNWIEYNIKEFNNGNITVSSENVITSEVEKLRLLKIGSYIFIKDKTKNIKMADDTSGNLQILKVD